MSPASGRGKAVAVFTLIVCLAMYCATAFGQWRVTGTVPPNPPFTTVNETNARGDTRETRYTREPNGRVSRMVQTTKDKQGRIISIVNEWYDERGNIIGGFRQQWDYNNDPDNPYRQDQEYRPAKGSQKGGWYNVPQATSSVSGLVVTELETPHGMIKVNLPNDLAAGDTISGTVLMDPVGKNQKELARNQEELKGYVVEVENQKTKTGQNWGKWLIPAASTAIALVVRDRRGREVARGAVPVETGSSLPTEIDETGTAVPVALPAKPPTEVLPSDYDLPPLGRAGMPAIIRGPFDGDSAATSVKIGGKAVPILAESPRQVVAQSPTEVFGPMPIEVNENNVVARGTYRNIAVNLAAAKTLLRNGERTTLTMTLRGFQGVEKPVLVKLTNHSPEVVNMEGGNVQEVEVAPQMIAADGTYVKTIPLIGLQPGSFSLGAALTSNIGDLIGNNSGIEIDNNPRRNRDDGLRERADEGLPLGSEPFTGRARRRLIEEWMKAWRARREAEAARKAADDAERSAEEARRAAKAAERTIEREPNAPDIDRLRQDADAKKADADAKKAEADTKKAAAQAAQDAADAAQDELRGAGRNISDRNKADSYKAEADRLSKEAGDAQAAADRLRGRIAREGDRDGSLKRGADERQKEAHEKARQAADLDRAAEELINPTPAPPPNTGPAPSRGGLTPPSR